MTRFISKSPATAEYYNALGQATFAHASLEWTIVCIARRLKTDFITPDFYNRWTSGKVQKEFKKLIETMTGNIGDIETDLLEISAEFALLVDRRNGLIHSQPITGNDGSAMLSRYNFIDSFHWTIPEIDSFASDVEALHSRAIHMLHNRMP